MIRSLSFLIADVCLFDYIYITKKLFLFMIHYIAIQEVAIEEIPFLTDMILNIVAVSFLRGLTLRTLILSYREHALSLRPQLLLLQRLLVKSAQL